ncbi:hypothetical protein LG634_02840 [Streptomyces bambusae]|uniref:hypothetical protein n=1 Tax=Streptomyces bambusae TaxID=1550616 RepID=UPI001CFD3E1D|nr:hypothetical protein [Streptomyces bambusae]MCB5163780.1 hypothetical protein [Streptomyces bambusae]
MAVAAVLAAVGGGAGGVGPAGGAGGGSGDPYGGDSLFLKRRQYLLELNGTAQEWTCRADSVLRAAVRRYHEGSVTLPVTVYRGIGVKGVAALAEPLGWRVDFGRTRYEGGKAVVLVPVSAGRVA